MLVITRKKGQRIVIGPGVTVTVLDFRRGWVRLGFNAPQEVKIVREEILGELERSAAASAADGRPSCHKG